MDDITSMDGESPPLVTSITSILGIKSQTLRFRPHKSTQKPHVILRRVQVSQNSGSDTSLGSSVYFSLFAQKRIEVKPGKEILLAVASPDERFKDQAMVLEGDIEESESESGEDSEREESVPPLQVSMPPKMRRAWNRNLEDASPTTDAGSATRVSVGVQAAPSVSTASVQSQPQVSCSSPSSTHVSSDMQTSVTHATTEVPTKIQSSLNTGSVSKDAHERSLSPMELDSQCNSTPDSPVFSPTGVPAMIAVLESGTNTPTSISSSLDVADMQISPTESPASPLTPLPSYMMLPSPGKQEDSDSMDFIKAESLLNCRLPDPICDAEKSSSSDDASVDLSEVPRTSSGGLSAEGLVHKRPQNTSAGVEKSKPLKLAIQNPFVSAGFVSDFIGSERKETPVDVAVSSTEPSTSREPAQTSTPAGVIAGESEEKGSHVPNDSSPSKMRPPSRPIPTEPRAARKKPPTVPRSMLVLSTTTPISENTSAATSSPPPDAKSLAYVAPGMASNPLGIRPCSLPTPRQTPVSSNPTKKRVVLGSGWPLTKATSIIVDNTSKPTPPATKRSGLLDIEGYSSPSPPSSPPPPPPPGIPPPVVSASGPEQSPPTPFNQMKGVDMPQLNSMGSKWKRICVQLPVQAEVPAISAVLKEKRPPTVSEVPAENKPDGNSLLSRLSSSVEKTVRKSTTPLEIPTKTTRQTDEAPSIPRMKRKASEGLDHFNNSFFWLIPGNDRCITHYTDEKKLFSQYVETSSILWTVDNIPSATPIPVQLPVNHPLPPKPVQSQNSGPSRGVKRERAPSPKIFDCERSKKPRQKFRWPTIECLHSVALKDKSDTAIKTIAISSDGMYAAVTCNRTTRMWNVQTRAELAQLSHGASVVSVVWMEGDSGIITLQEDGVGSNQWHWTKIVNAGKDKDTEEDSMCLAYGRDRVAVSLPRSGVKIWIWSKGTWQPQRAILRQNVSAIKFVHDGSALLGGTRDGVLWHSEVPNGTLRVYAFMKTKIVDIDLNAGGTCALVAQTGGVARLVDIQADRRGQVTAVYSNTETETRPSGDFGAVFVANGQGVLHGSSGGCVLIWDTKKGSLVYGLEHEEDDIIQAAAGFDGSPAKDGCIITGTKQGHLSWWSQPSQSESMDADKCGTDKRTKTA
ncbi:WD40 repeat-like protein [Guyanagaster necrorhizus]|uniref:WD40 repeat-like protein n=1 Tax=Guyanagaster necrorhizus TaxID=856835 RepID=A0A9P7W6S5_9AGAR|nr:WD40 repeat-like protein [Guyanagaster necrorhizus MCA 3950]KAG7453000.1 WD40 repeat-like protein [Guyanagaster necrorhizus MCA 3950]